MGTTPKGYPYPEDTDLESQGAQAIKALALAIDTSAGRSASGRTSMSLPTANTTTSGPAITFPVGRFTATPTVIIARVTGYNSSTLVYYWPASSSATGFVLTGVANAVVGSATIDWAAVQAP